MHAAPPAMAAAPPARRGRRGGGCLLSFVLLLTIGGVAAWLLITQVVQPRVGDMAVDGIRDGVREAVQDRIATEVGLELSGEVTITEQEITDRLQSHGNLGPIDDIQVHINPDGLSVDLSAYGLGGTYKAAVIEQDGSLALTNGHLDGALAYAVPEGELESAINRELAAALAAGGYRVEDVTLGDGALTLALTSES